MLEKELTTSEALVLGGAVVGAVYGGYRLYKHFTEDDEAKRTGIHGRVTDSLTGETIQWALILINRKLNGDFGPTHTAESDDSGYYAITGIEPGEYWCTCMGSGYMFSSAIITVVKGTLSRWDVGLEPTAAATAVLSGTVKDARTKELLAGVYVYIKYYLDSVEHTIYDTYTDSQGRYRISGIMVGVAGTEYECNAGITGYYSYDEPKVLYEGEQELNIEIFKLGEAYGTASIRGTVTDYDTGLPIEGVEVKLYSPGYEGWPYKINFTTITDADGQYWFEYIPGIEYSISAYLNPFVDYWPYPTAEITQYITAIEGQELVWDIVLIPYVEPVAATLYGIVTDSSTGLPIPGALIWIWNIGISKGVYANAIGEYDITDLPPWPEYKGYLVNFSKEGYSEVYEEDVVLQSGEVKELNVQLTPSVSPGKASVHGRVTDAYTGSPLPLAHVFFTSEDGAYYYGIQTDSKGEYRIDDMEALSYNGGCFITTEDAGKPYHLGTPVYITLAVDEDKEVNWELVPL